jgi:hypothetical protein
MTDPSRVRTRRCGCAGSPRRRCDLCDPERQVFLACSAACVDRHRREVHGPAGADDTPARVQRSQEALNRARPDPDADRYRPHRDRLGRLLRAVQRGPGLCVLGAGNCDDLDLPGLVREFGEVHLCDLDGQALAGAVARVTGPARERITTQGGLDLSGAVALIDRWGDHFPDDRELAAFASATAATLGQAIGRTFDVVLSACLLSQLYVPLRESLILGLDDWQRLFSAIERAHLGTVATLTRPGGTGVLALDVTTSRKLPELAAFSSDPATWDGLGPAADQAIARRGVTLDPDPRRLLQHLGEPGAVPLPPGRTVERARLTEPWVWQTGESLSALVYALVFSSGAG